VADVFDANGNAVGASDDDFADIVGGFYEAEATDIVELTALSVETSAGVGVVGAKRVENLDDRKVEVVELHRIEKNVVLHGGAAKARVVGNAGNAFVGAFDDPVFVGVQLHRGTVGAFDDVAIDQAAGAEEWRDARRDALRKCGVAKALENNLARKIRIDSFVEGQA